VRALRVCRETVGTRVGGRRVVRAAQHVIPQRFVTPLPCEELVERPGNLWLRSGWRPAGGHLPVVQQRRDQGRLGKHELQRIGPGDQGTSSWLSHQAQAAHRRGPKGCHRPPCEPNLFLVDTMTLWSGETARPPLPLRCNVMQCNAACLRVQIPTGCVLSPVQSDY
jgi:hypothetical protein